MNTEIFESRKADHLRLALHPRMDAASSGLENIHLSHEALPEMDFNEVKLQTKFWAYTASSPCFISSMTAGHNQGEALNITLARVAQKKNWPMGLGSQRRELTDPAAKEEWKRLRAAAPKAFLMSNLGLSQLIHSPAKQVLALAESLDAKAFIVHTNPLQESLQPEGTPNFKGGIKALEKFCKISPIPVILKETGCGFSLPTIKKIEKIGLSALDIAGYGGTHWGRIEGGRANENSPERQAAQVFAYWGESTVESLLAAQSAKKLEIWASGGIRSGLDAAKTLAMGAHKVGFAKPALEKALLGEEALEKWMDQIQYEMKIALFCSGVKTPTELRKGKRWRKI